MDTHDFHLLRQVSFESQLPNSQQPNSGDIRYGVLRVTTSSGVQVYKTGDVVKLDTKPIIYGKVKYFVKVSKKNDVDKVVVHRQPDEVNCVTNSLRRRDENDVGARRCENRNDQWQNGKLTTESRVLPFSRAFAFSCDVALCLLNLSKQQL